MDIKIQLLEYGKKPKLATEGSAGYDLYAPSAICIPPCSIQLIKMGFKIQMPRNIEAQIRSRSGLGLKKRITVYGAPGTIDSDYREEVGVVLYNDSDVIFQVEENMRIAQMVFSYVEHPTIHYVEELDISDRTGGFGSTGL